jgi:hypothetical protein
VFAAVCFQSSEFRIQRTPDRRPEARRKALLGTLGWWGSISPSTFFPHKNLLVPVVSYTNSERRPARRGLDGRGRWGSKKKCSHLRSRVNQQDNSDGVFQSSCQTSSLFLWTVNMYWYRVTISLYIEYSLYCRRETRADSYCIIQYRSVPILARILILYVERDRESRELSYVLVQPEQRYRVVARYDGVYSLSTVHT